MERIAVVGGVAANSELRAALPGAALAPLELCTDNAAMIASAARFVEAIPFPAILRSMRTRLRRREAAQLGVLGALAVAATLLVGSAAASRQHAREHEDLARVGLARARRRPAPAGRGRPARDRRPQRSRRSPTGSPRPGAGDRSAAAAVDARRRSPPQKLLIARLAQQGVLRQAGVPLHPRPQRLLRAARPARGRAARAAPEVAGVYPVRVAYPASVSCEPARRQGRLAAAAAAGPELGCRAIDGRGVTIALLDTGVDRRQPYLRGSVLAGDRRSSATSTDASAAAEPRRPTRLERHGTEMAGLLVGSGGPAELAGVAPGATVLPIRVAGWQRDARRRWAVYARTDQLIAGLERAVDPNLRRRSRTTLRASRSSASRSRSPRFADAPSARAVAGALRLDTLVVAPAGNDGAAGPGFGSVAGPGGAPAALTVGAADLRGRAAIRCTVGRARGARRRARPSACRSPGAVAPSVAVARARASPRRDRASGLRRSPRSSTSSTPRPQPRRRPGRARAGRRDPAARGGRRPRRRAQRRRPLRRDSSRPAARPRRRR